ncbi:MAG TPA: formate dehydrogenase accessory sulfurtransferase FdhD [Flavobacterium sp.]|nr:formate dehydrogenase accessory sulfurtransferase FdhD [Flavobacterium sp.]
MSLKLYKGIFYNDKKFSSVEDFLVVEVALSIAVNDIPFTVTMQTPGNEIELARGLLYTEKIYQNLDINPIVLITGYTEDGFINSLNFIIDPQFILKDFAGNRNVISSSSCGVCGRTELDELDETHINNSKLLYPSTIEMMFDKVSDNQKAFQQSGGTHAAGAFTVDGELLNIQEDIGRHNAVDKVIGYLIQNNIIHKVDCLTVSGRISYEIVSKAKEAGIKFLASVSAPSTLAVDTAQKAGITLMAFCRKNKLTIYSNSNQVIQNSVIDSTKV